MYFVDREKIEATLVFLERQTNLLVSKEVWVTEIEKAAQERLVHMVIESILDIGNSMIDGFIMRDPGSYEDIIDILVDEKVILDESGQSLKDFIQCRKSLVQLYTEIDHGELYRQFSSNLQALTLFPNNIRQYLTNELGPVSAFKK
ncbi:MAG: hypothetical protein K0Q87_939 [Neobacillus sp.]|jgi:uncharacterized protein YutE (UPF0331/DUF86 family)|nr:hypothetical protein [Neobacillus sp.]